MNSLTAHRLVIGGLVVLLALAVWDILKVCNADGNPVHLHLAPNNSPTPAPVTVSTNGAWPPACNNQCYVTFEYLKIPNPTGNTLSTCTSGASCLSVTGPANSSTATPFTISSEAKDGTHQPEHVNGQFIVIVSSKL